jgi:septum formation protein
MAPKLVLASQSDTRASLLRQASVDFDIINARVDEAAVKESMLADGASPRDIVDALAELKAFRATSRTISRSISIKRASISGNFAARPTSF